MSQRLNTCAIVLRKGLIASGKILRLNPVLVSSLCDCVDVSDLFLLRALTYA